MEEKQEYKHGRQVYESPMTRHNILLPDHQWEWLQDKGNAAEFIRGLIEKAMIEELAQ